MNPANICLKFRLAIRLKMQSSLKDAVVDELCKVVTIEMVGEHYTSTASGQVLNHLYRPVYMSVKRHLKRMPKRHVYSFAKAT